MSASLSRPGRLASGGLGRHRDRDRWNKGGLVRRPRKAPSGPNDAAPSLTSIHFLALCCPFFPFLQPADRIFHHRDRLVHAGCRRRWRLSAEVPTRWQGFWLLPGPALRSLSPLPSTHVSRATASKGTHGTPGGTALRNGTSASSTVITDSGDFVVQKGRQGEKGLRARGVPREARVRATLSPHAHLVERRHGHRTRACGSGDSHVVDSSRRASRRGTIASRSSIARP